MSSGVGLGMGVPGFRYGTRCTGAMVLGSLNQSWGALLLAPRVKPRWWGETACFAGSLRNRRAPVLASWAGAKANEQYEVVRAHGSVPKRRQRCRRRLAPSRSAGSSCLEARRTGVRGATEYISGRGFVITALSAFTTDQRQRCPLVRPYDARDEAPDRLTRSSGPSTA